VHAVNREADQEHQEGRTVAGHLGSSLGRVGEPRAPRPRPHIQRAPIRCVGGGEAGRGRRAGRSVGRRTRGVRGWTDGCPRCCSGVGYGNAVGRGAQRPPARQAGPPRGPNSTRDAAKRPFFVGTYTDGEGRRQRPRRRAPGGAAASAGQCGAVANPVISWPSPLRAGCYKRWTAGGTRGQRQGSDRAPREDDQTGSPAGARRTNHPCVHTSGLVRAGGGELQLGQRGGATGCAPTEGSARARNLDSTPGPARQRRKEGRTHQI